MVVVLTIISRKLYIAMWFNTGTEGLNLLHHHKLRLMTHSFASIWMQVREILYSRVTLYLGNQTGLRVPHPACLVGAYTRVGTAGLDFGTVCHNLALQTLRTCLAFLTSSDRSLWIMWFDIDWLCPISGQSHLRSKIEEPRQALGTNKKFVPMNFLHHIPYLSCEQRATVISLGKQEVGKY